MIFNANKFFFDADCALSGSWRKVARAIRAMRVGGGVCGGTSDLARRVEVNEKVGNSNRQGAGCVRKRCDSRQSLRVDDSPESGSVHNSRVKNDNV